MGFLCIACLAEWESVGKLGVVGLVYTFLQVNNAEKHQLVHPSQQRLHEIQFLQKPSRQKPCGDQARLPSLVNKQVVRGRAIGWFLQVVEFKLRGGSVTNGVTPIPRLV